MLLIGLTGSIATGKSTCSSILSSPPYSLPVIDADILARKAVEPGTWGYRRIVATFGPSTPDLLLPGDGDNRPINRTALGKRVFGSSEERTADRKKLNAIVHPAVRFLMARSLLYYYVTGYWAVVLDVPLLFESGLDIFCSSVVVVSVSDPKIQMQRLRDRDSHLDPDDAKNRVASQVDVRQKAARAMARNGGDDGTKPTGLGRGTGRGYVLTNDGSQDDLKLQIADIMVRIQQGSPKWWAWLLLFAPPLMMGVSGWEFMQCWAAKQKWEREKGKELAKPKL